MEFTVDPGPQWPHILILIGAVIFLVNVLCAAVSFIEVLFKGRRALWDEYEGEDMFRCRTFKFEESGDLLDFLDEIDPTIRTFDMDQQTIRVKVEEEFLEATDYDFKRYNGVPTTEWEDVSR